MSEANTDNKPQMRGEIDRMLHAKIEAYEGTGRVHWNVTLRDLDAGPDERGLISLRGGLSAVTDDDVRDQMAAALRQAIESLISEDLSAM